MRLNDSSTMYLLPLETIEYNGRFLNIALISLSRLLDLNIFLNFWRTYMKLPNPLYRELFLGICSWEIELTKSRIDASYLVSWNFSLYSSKMLIIPAVPSAKYGDKYVEHSVILKNFPFIVDSIYFSCVYFIKPSIIIFFTRTRNFYST